jgi:hypothetical protein
MVQPLGETGRPVPGGVAKGRVEMTATVTTLAGETKQLKVTLLDHGDGVFSGQYVGPMSTLLLYDEFRHAHLSQPPP